MADAGDGLFGIERGHLAPEGAGERGGIAGRAHDEAHPSVRDAESAGGRPRPSSATSWRRGVPDGASDTSVPRPQ